MSVVETPPSRPAGLLASRTACTLRLPVFEGPLDLLLHLIRNHKLDISEISISLVTEQYLEYLYLMEQLDLEVAGEFLVIAATLMEIKSRSLLPRPDPPSEEEGIDPRVELVQRLLEYERFQHVAEQLKELAAQNSRSFTRPVVEQWEGAVPLVELKPADLLSALRLMRRGDDEDGAGKAPPSLRVRRHAVNLKQRMAEVLRRVRGHFGPLPFSLLVFRGEERLPRLEVLVTFLAVLELMRQSELSAWQAGPLGEILLTLPDAPTEPSGAASVVTN